MMGLLLHADFIITLFFGQKYTDSIPVLKVFAFSMPFIFNMNGTLFTTIDKQKINTLMDALSVMITLTACFFLIPHYKENGAAAAFVCSVSIAYVISTGIMIKKRLVDYVPVLRQRAVMALAVAGIWYANQVLQPGNHYLAMAGNGAVYCTIFAAFFVRSPEIKLLKDLVLPEKSPGQGLICFYVIIKTEL
jgi:O-antigen/teichoic acid export membrane protein